MSVGSKHTYRPVLSSKRRRPAFAVLRDRFCRTTCHPVSPTRSDSKPGAPARLHDRYMFPRYVLVLCSLSNTGGSQSVLILLWTTSGSECSTQVTKVEESNKGLHRTNGDSMTGECTGIKGVGSALTVILVREEPCWRCACTAQQTAAVHVPLAYELDVRQDTGNPPELVPSSETC